MENELDRRLSLLLLHVLFPAGQPRVLELLVRRVDVRLGPWTGPACFDLDQAERRLGLQ